MSWKKYLELRKEEKSKKPNKLMDYFNYITTIFIIIMTIQYVIVANHVKKDVAPNCFAYCNGKNLNLESVRTSYAPEELGIFCKCLGDQEVWGNNFSYVEPFNISKQWEMIWE